MDEQEIRRLVRQAIARHLGPAPEEGGASARQHADATAVAPAVFFPSEPERHPSAARFILLRPANETECVIEPSVTCNHCGYCQCFGH